MTPLDLKKKKLEIMRVETALFDLEVKIMELQAEAERLEAHSEISKQTLLKLRSELSEHKD